jgi:hypothetical protein
MFRRTVVTVLFVAVVLVVSVSAASAKTGKYTKSGCKVAWHWSNNQVAGVSITDEAAQTVRAFHHQIPRDLQRFVDRLTQADPSVIFPQLALACYVSGYLRLSSADQTALRQQVDSLLQQFPDARVG